VHLKGKRSICCVLGAVLGRAVNYRVNRYTRATRPGATLATT